MLSKLPFMSSKRVEAFIPAFWDAMTSCLRDRAASAVDMLGREPHWFWLTSARVEEREYSRSDMSLSSILEIVWSREIILKEAGVE